MMIVSFAVAVMAVTLILIAVVVIPTALELRKTAAMVREVVTRVDNELQPALKDLNLAIAEIRAVTTVASSRKEDLEDFLSVVGDTGRGLRTISSMIGTVAETFTRSSVWLTGAKVAGKFAYEKFARKGR